jgi:hypothetical protein
MSEIRKIDKEKLDGFSRYTPALYHAELPGERAMVKIGSYLDKALSSVAVEAVYDFARHGGEAGTFRLGTYLPAGAIVTDVITDTLTAVESLGLPEFALKLDTATVVTIADATALSAVEKQTVAPKKAASRSELCLEVGTDITAGKVRFIVQYLLP